MKPDHDLAQLYYERALREESSAQAPVYLMNLYSRWQRLDVPQTFISFVTETFTESWSKGLVVIIANIAYVITIVFVVMLLRRDSLKEE
jgi:hypothetical protein